MGSRYLTENRLLLMDGVLVMLAGLCSCLMSNNTSMTQHLTGTDTSSSLCSATCNNTKTVLGLQRKAMACLREAAVAGSVWATHLLSFEPNDVETPPSRSRETEIACVLVRTDHLDVIYYESA